MGLKLPHSFTQPIANNRPQAGNTYYQDYARSLLQAATANLGNAALLSSQSLLSPMSLAANLTAAAYAQAVMENANNVTNRTSLTYDVQPSGNESAAPRPLIASFVDRMP